MTRIISFRYAPRGAPFNKADKTDLRSVVVVRRHTLPSWISGRANRRLLADPRLVHDRCFCRHLSGRYTLWIVGEPVPTSLKSRVARGVRRCRRVDLNLVKALQGGDV